MTAHIDPAAQHAVYAPSSAHRWSICTASAEGISKLPEQEEGEEAAKGTAAHEEIERCLTQDWTGQACSKCSTYDDAFGACPGCGGTGEMHGPVPRPDLVNPNHPAARGVALVLDFVRQLPPGTLWIEQRVILTPEIWGRCDVAHWDAATYTLTIVDYKNGYVDVQAEENEQLMIYAAAVAYMHKLPLKWARLVIVQPNSIVPGPRVKQWPVSAATLYEFAAKVAVIPGGPKQFVAGEQCKYCPLFGRCPASQDLLRDLSAVLCNAADAVPVAQYARFKAAEKPIADFFKAADKHMTKRAIAGQVPAGMKLVTGSKHRQWRNEAAARAYAIERFGVDKLSPPTPAQMEDMGAPKEDVTAMADKPKGGPVLAFENDKRAPWSETTVQEMFAGVTQKTA